MILNRRKFFIHSAAALLATRCKTGLSAHSKTVRIGLTPVILDDHSLFLSQWRQWLEMNLQMPVTFIQRPRYRDITELLLDGTLSAAWICGYPYVRYQEHFRLLAQPVYHQKSTYNSLIIAGSHLKNVKTLEDFHNKTFSFSDPDSNSGYLYPTFRLHEKLKQNPDFFRKTFFSWGHKNTIEAVAAGLADGGAVDSYVWEVLTSKTPSYAQAVRIVERSPEFGFPPLVTLRSLNDDLHEKLREVLLSMHKDETGKSLLKQLSLDGFVEGNTKNYASIARMMSTVTKLGLDKSL